MAKTRYENWTTRIYNFASDVTNLWRQPTRQHNLELNKYLPYFGDKDNFPLIWHKAISESPSATACVSTIQDFLEGVDFSDPELSKREVNSKGETFYQIHQRTCKDFAEFEGFYWRFMFDATGKITQWEVLPFENCRLGKPDSSGYISKIVYNPYFGTDDFQTLKDQDTTWYDCFNPKYVRDQYARDGEKYKGQVLFIGTTTALSRFYPLPEAYSAFSWMEAETGIANYYSGKIKNGFLQSFMLLMRGNPNEPSKNPEYTSLPEQERMTRGQEFDEVISKNFMGEGDSNLMVQWVENPDEKPEILSFPNAASSDMFINTDIQATKKITTAFKVMSILANIHEGASLGGDGNTVRVAVKIQQQRIKKKQRVLTDAYEMVWKNFSTLYTQPIDISPYNPYPELEVLDDKIWNAMTKDERRDWIEKNTEIELFDDAVEPEAIEPTQARVTNKIPTAFPDKVRANVKKSLDYQEKMGHKCGGRAGRQVAESIMNNENMGMRQLKRIYSYLKKNESMANSGLSDGCKSIEYQAWGGKEMFDFLEGELKRLDAWLN